MNIENLKLLALSNAGVHSSRKLIILLGFTPAMVWGLFHPFSFRGGIGHGKPRGRDVHTCTKMTDMCVVLFRG